MVPELRRPRYFDLIRRYGSSCLAYSTLQPGLHYHECSAIEGFLAHARLWHPLLAPSPVTIAVAEPVCETSAAATLIESFQQVHPAAVFLQVGAATASILRRLGLLTARLGVECAAELGCFEPSSQLRRLERRAQREGVTVEECPIDEVDRDELLAVSADWLRRKGGREIRLLARPLAHRAEPDVRCFWARRDGRLIGFVVFDPIYRDRRIVGYYHNIVRYRGEAPLGTIDLITLAAMRRFRSDGIAAVSFGLCPLTDANRSCQDKGESDIVHAPFQRMLDRARECAADLYPFRGNEQFKRKYSPRVDATYLAIRPRSGLRDLAAALVGMRLIQPRDPTRLPLFRALHREAVGWR
jgi:phosphatidylglycerol lysyltransferase